MSADREREEEIFDVAREITSADEQAASLARICGGNTELRERIEGMLKAAQPRANSSTGPKIQGPRSWLKATVRLAVLRDGVGSGYSYHRVLRQELSANHVNEVGIIEIASIPGRTRKAVVELEGKSVGFWLDPGDHPEMHPGTESQTVS